MMTCDVCGSAEVIGVGSSSLGPISNAYCGICAANLAEPAWLLAATLDCVGGTEHVADWVKNIQTFVDDKYVTYDEFIKDHYTYREINYDEDCSGSDSV